MCLMTLLDIPAWRFYMSGANMHQKHRGREAGFSAARVSMCPFFLREGRL